MSNQQIPNSNDYIIDVVNYNWGEGQRVPSWKTKKWVPVFKGSQYIQLDNYWVTPWETPSELRITARQEDVTEDAMLACQYEGATLDSDLVYIDADGSDFSLELLSPTVTASNAITPYTANQLGFKKLDSTNGQQIVNSVAVNWFSMGESAFDRFGADKDLGRFFVGQMQKIEAIDYEGDSSITIDLVVNSAIEPITEPVITNSLTGEVIGTFVNFDGYELVSEPENYWTYGDVLNIDEPTIYAELAGSPTITDTLGRTFSVTMTNNTNNEVRYKLDDGSAIFGVGTSTKTITVTDDTSKRNYIQTNATDTIGNITNISVFDITSE